MKNLNKLWIYGDSYSKGLGVTDDTYQYDYYKGKENLIWSRLLAKELGLKEVNKALNGISNDMIFDIIKDTFDEVKQGDYVVIGLTKIPRLGIYKPDAKLKLKYNKTPLRDTTTDMIPFGNDWLAYIRNNMKDAYEDIMETFLFACKAFHLKGVKTAVWDNTLWGEFKTIREECKYHDDGHWGVEGHADMAKYILKKNSWKSI